MARNKININHIENFNGNIYMEHTEQKVEHRTTINWVHYAKEVGGAVGLCCVGLAHGFGFVVQKALIPTLKYMLLEYITLAQRTGESIEMWQLSRKDTKTIEDIERMKKLASKCKIKNINQG